MADQLSDLHLADLHERAAAAGIAGYRKLRREELIEALEGRDGDSEAGGAARESRSESGRRRGRRGGRGRSRGGRRPAGTGEPDADEVVVEATVLDDATSDPVELGPLDAEGGDVAADELATEEARGVLDLTRQGFGFLRLSGLTAGEGDVYISAAQVRRCELRRGDEVIGPAREPRRGERHRALVHVDRVNGVEPGAEARPGFESLPAVQPEGRLLVEIERDEVLARAVDLLAPLAFGQRVLIRAGARSGRTTLLRSLARAAATAGDATKIIVLLVDERPEEATAWREALPVAEFAIATADLAPIEHVRTADLALERARRIAEAGGDAVLICDSLSRLAHAAGDTAEVKRLFGSGRNLAGGGSLTMLATVLAEDPDDEAARAVTTTESSLVVLDPELAAAGITPAIRASECRVSNEDSLREPAELEAIRKLRTELADLSPRESADLLRERIETTASNAELLSLL